MGGGLPAAPRGRRKKRLKVAASFGRTEFSCSACEREQAQGGDPKGRRSGTPGSCEGPRRHVFYGGAAEWTGCPRLSLRQREASWIGAHDRAGGQLSVSEQAAAPMLLLDVFDALDELKAQAQAYEAAQRESEAQQRPGVLR